MTTTKDIVKEYIKACGPVGVPSIIHEVKSQTVEINPEAAVRYAVDTLRNDREIELYDDCEGREVYI